MDNYVIKMATKVYFFLLSTSKKGKNITAEVSICNPKLRNK